MKYYDRKNTPLKWNWVLKITLPFLLISSLVHIVSVFQQLFGLKTGNLNDFLASAGYSVNHMGPLFWPVIFHSLMSCLSAVIVFYACVGLWKWKEYGPKAVCLRFVVEFIESLIVMIYMMKNPSYIPQSDTAYSTSQTVESSSQMEDTQVLSTEITNEQFEPYYCTECGEKITDPNITFCPNCGKKLK